MQGWKSLFAVVFYNTAYRKWNLRSWQEVVFWCLTYAFCWKWAPGILKVSSVGVSVAVHCETEFGIEFNPLFGQRVHVWPAVDRRIFWDLGTLLCFMGWRFPAWLLDTVPGAELPEPQLNRATTSTWKTSSIPRAYLSVKRRACSVTKQKADMSRVTSLFLLEMIKYF